jgi:ATP/maltotriose-dependent transcriptional regulator MalT
MRLVALAFACAAWLGSAAACTTVRTDLRTAQLLYKDARYEEAALWLSELESQAPDMDGGELARFHYLRGMTAFRLGQREEALHYLVLADQLVSEDTNALPAAWRSVMERTLQEIMPTGASPHARNPLRPDTF